MNENLKKFLEEASKNEGLKMKLASLPYKDTATEKTIKIAKEYGFTLTAEDFRPIEVAELSADELDKVAGGEYTTTYTCPYCGMVFEDVDTILGGMNANWHKATHMVP